MPPILADVESGITFADATKAGAALLALLMLYSLLKPLIASLIASQSKFVENQTAFATTLQGLTTVISEMRKDLREHSDGDSASNQRILRGEACRYDPSRHREPPKTSG